MANYPVYQYQPQVGSWGQNAQPMYQIPSAQVQQQTEQPLFCRMATSKEEVLATPVDFSGRPMTFLGPGLQTVWIKLFNANTGGSDVIELQRPGVQQMAAVPAQTEQPDYVTMGEFEKLVGLVRQQGEAIDQMRTPRRRAGREQEATEDAV